MTETLKWCAHAQFLKAKLCKVIYMVNILKEIMSPYMIKIIYFSNFESCMRNGIVTCWSTDLHGSARIVSRCLGMAGASKKRFSRDGQHKAVELQRAKVKPVTSIWTSFLIQRIVEYTRFNT